MRVEPFRRVWILIAAAFCAACTGGAHPAPAPRAAPRHIVSLSPALTEILYALGLGDRVAGVTSFCDYPPEAAAKPKIGGYANPSVEAILALSPDLVIVSPGPGNRDAALALRRAGVEVEVVAAETLSETYAAIEAVGRACGEAERGRALAASVRGRVEAVAARTAKREKVPALFCVQTEPIIAAGAGTLPSELMEAAGARNVVVEPRYPRLSLEAVVGLAPQVILQARMDVPAASRTNEEAAFWMRWAAIPAVHDRRVHALDLTTALRPGPRVGEAAEMLEKLFHPGAAPEKP